MNQASKAEEGESSVTCNQTQHFDSPNKHNHVFLTLYINYKTNIIRSKLYIWIEYIKSLLKLLLVKITYVSKVLTNLILAQYHDA